VAVWPSGSVVAVTFPAASYAVVVTFPSGSLVAVT
jgi:hypothetical protein